MLLLYLGVKPKAYAVAKSQLRKGCPHFEVRPLFFDSFSGSQTRLLRFIN